MINCTNTFDAVECSTVEGVRDTALTVWFPSVDVDRACKVCENWVDETNIRTVRN